MFVGHSTGVFVGVGVGELDAVGDGGAPGLLLGCGFGVPVKLAVTDGEFWGVLLGVIVGVGEGVGE